MFMKKAMKLVCAVLALCLLAAAPALAAKEKKAPARTVAKALDGAALLAQPRADGAFVASLPSGGEIKVVHIGLSWCKAEADGKEGYVATRLLSFSDVSGDEAFAVVAAKGGQLTLRKKSTVQSKALDKFKNGTVAAVVEKGDTFTKVLVAGKEGYLLTKHLTFSGAVESAGTATVTWPEETKKARTVKLRWASKTGGNVITTLKTGVSVVILKADGDWTQVEADGKVGYLMSKYLKADAAAQTPAFPPAPQSNPAFPPAPQSNTAFPPAPQPGKPAKPTQTPKPTQEPGEYVNPNDLEEVVE